MRHRTWTRVPISLTAAGLLGIGTLGFAGTAHAGPVVSSPLTQHLAPIDVHGGYVAAGTGLENRGYGSIHLAGVPSGAAVAHAYLYWMIEANGANPGASFADGKVDGTPIAGQLVGQNSPTCNLVQNAWTYRADVTALVHGDGDYRLSSFRSAVKDGRDPHVAGTDAPFIDGASLVVVYDKTSYPLTRVLLADGNVKGSNGSATLTWGFPATDPVPEVRTTFIGGNASDAPGPTSTFNGFAQTKIDWDGSDPQVGGNYAAGNHWDTDTVSVGRRVRPGDTSAVAGLRWTEVHADCVHWVAQVLSIGVDGGADTDHDGLLDGWEANGNDEDGNGTYDVNLQSMGASVVHKDVFVEMDTMGAESVCPCHLPLAPDLDRIVAAFAASPYADNPDGKPGIALHLDAGPYRGAKYDLGGGNVVPHDDDLNPVATEYTPLKAANFSPLRKKTFHYMIWAHGYDGGTSSGLSFGIGADDFIVTLGKWADHGSSDAKVGTFIHELGHNLGLRHGGGDDVNFKPDYLSVMNYFFQVSGVPQSDGGSLFSYARYKMPSLNEHALDEHVGLASPRAAGFLTRWYCPDGTIRQTDAAANGPIDWNCDNTIASVVATDVNHDAVRTTLGSWRDWGNLVFTGGDIGADGTGTPAGRSAPIAPMPPELTYEESLRLTR